MIDPTGTTSSLYDSLDRQTRVTYPAGKTVQATYDRAGNRTSLINPGNLTTTYAYDWRQPPHPGRLHRHHDLHLRSSRTRLASVP